jgi:chaperonin GroEL
MAKVYQLNRKARESLVKGINIVATLVGTTLGPKGRNVAIEKSYGAPTVTNDGVTVAKEIELKDKFENIGAKLIIEASNKTNDVAGDGTTTATILAQSLVVEGYKLVSAGIDPMALKRGMDKGVERVIHNLKSNSRPVADKSSIKNVATISSGDIQVGEMIAEVMEKVGKDGVVTVEEGKGLGLEIEYTEGMSIDRGFISPYMVTRQDGMVAEYNDTFVLITDKKISSIQEVLPILEKVAKEGKREMVIIAEDVDGEALANIIVNKLKGTFNILAVKAPAFGDRRKAMLQDIAVLTGGKVISEEVGLKFDTVELEDLGTARTIRSDKENTVIVVEKDAATTARVQERVSVIKAEIEATTSDYDKEKLQERLAKLGGGVGVIKVGATTEVEMKEKKYRIEDALNSTRAAVEEGIVVGGGCALVHTLSDLEDLKFENADENMGVELLKKAVVAPLEKIAENAGAPEKVILEELKKKAPNEGFNAMSNSFVDMFEAGIIDPLKVTRSALDNARSIAGMVLTVGAIIVEEPKEEKDPAMPPGGMGMGMDDMY